MGKTDGEKGRGKSSMRRRKRRERKVEKKNEDKKKREKMKRRERRKRWRRGRKMDFAEGKCSCFKVRYRKLKRSLLHQYPHHRRQCHRTGSRHRLQVQRCLSRWFWLREGRQGNIIHVYVQVRKWGPLLFKVRNRMHYFTMTTVVMLQPPTSSVSAESTPFTQILSKHHK